MIRLLANGHMPATKSRPMTTIVLSIVGTHSKGTSCPTHAHRAIKHLLEALKPYTIENGGVLKVEHVWYVEGRGNLTIEYTPEGATGE